MDEEQIDLNLSNYSLNDILNLFKLNLNFSSQELKNAKKMVLMTHPDKSGLPPKYFQFYTRAYETLHKVYKFKIKDEALSSKELNNDYFSEALDDNDKEANRILLQKNGFLTKEFNASKGFLKKFNKMFEEYVLTNKEDDGYHDWLKSKEDELPSNLSQTEIHKRMEEKRQNMRALICSDDIKTISSSDYLGASSITNEKVGYYEAPIFNNGLQYDDLKRAHTESIIPVTIEDYNEREKFSSSDHLKRHRETMMRDIDWSKETAQTKLNIQNQILDQEDCNRYFNLMKEQESMMEINKKFWKDLKQITN